MKIDGLALDHFDGLAEQRSGELELVHSVPAAVVGGNLVAG